MVDRSLETPKSIPEKVIDPNRDKQPLDVVRLSEVGKRNKSTIPKIQLISNVIGNIDDSMDRRRQYKKK